MPLAAFSDELFAHKPKPTKEKSSMKATNRKYYSGLESVALVLRTLMIAAMVAISLLPSSIPVAKHELLR